MMHSISKNSLILACFAIGTATTLALTNLATRDKVACNRQQALVTSLGQVMPAQHHDNNLLADSVVLSHPLLGRGEHRAYRARLAGAPSGLVLEATAGDGYGGAIALIIGVDMHGTVQGVRVVPPHNETPGLGDKIETRKSDWILSFTGTALGNPEQAGWAVDKDGGDFDSFTGATITPRAIVQAVYRSLQFLEQHPGLFDLPAAGDLETSCHG